jgi:hypothetical protein
VSFDRQHSDFRELARAALTELDAAESDRSPAQLMGGPLAWGDNQVAVVEAQRDPANAPTMRPHVIAPCQKLQTHPALRLHCSCGSGLTFLALTSSTTGVTVVSSPLILPPKLRRGGMGDLVTVATYDPANPWTSPQTVMMRRCAANVHAFGRIISLTTLDFTSYSERRQRLTCDKCEATHTFLNITLLRLVLGAIAVGERKVRLRTQAMVSAAPQR